MAKPNIGETDSAGKPAVGSIEPFKLPDNGTDGIDGNASIAGIGIESAESKYGFKRDGTPRKRPGGYGRTAGFGRTAETQTNRQKLPDLDILAGALKATHEIPAL